MASENDPTGPDILYKGPETGKCYGVNSSDDQAVRKSGQCPGIEQETFLPCVGCTYQGSVITSLLERIGGSVDVRSGALVWCCFGEKKVVI